MDVIQTSSVKIPNSVIVSGIAGTETDEELYDFLKEYGPIQRRIPVDSAEPASDKQVIVEYVYGTAMQSLLPSLPHRLNSKTQTDVTYHIRALASVYTPEASKTATQTYLSELKDIAKLTGKDFAAVLREELSVISESVDLDQSETQDEDKEQNSPDTPGQYGPENAAQESPLPSTVPEQHVQYHWSPPPSKEKTQPTLKLSDVNPPDIQKVIVEHIVRNEDSALQVHTSLRLRPFSGRFPRSNNEVDYETWRSNVELLLKDTTQSDLYKSRKLLESLLSPAIDIVKHLTPESPLNAYLEILDSAFGTVEDGDDLFAKYLNTMQDNGEKPSAYLQRLQVMLNTTLRRGGVTASDLDRHLLRQFVRGCWDNILIAELQLEQKKQNPEKYHNPKDLFGDRWTPACQAAFDTIIEKLTTAPILGFADPKLPYILHTDASTSGLGAALYQEQQGQKRVVAYASRGLSKCESRYPAHKLEFLALKWAVTEKFQDYLYGNTFLAVTDSNPLTYILTSAKLDATSYRWLAALSTFDFQLQFRAGKQNQDADRLSRPPHGRLPDDTSSRKELERIQQFTKRHLSEADYAHLDENTIKAICEKHLVRQVINNHSGETSPSTTLVVSLAHHPKALPQSFEEEDQLGGLPVIPSLSPAELRDKQNADPCIREVLRQVELEEKPPPSLRKELPELGLLLREWSKLTVLNGVLYRKRQEGAQTHYQLVLPEVLRPLVLKSLHDDMGHMGAERTLDLVRKRFYWPKMSGEVETKVKTCNRCIRRKTMPEKAAPLVNIVATRPLELVCMDFLSVEPDSSNTKDILVITDHFTKYAVAVPTPNQKARTVAKSLWDHFFVHYGIPEKLHSDQGPDFESRTIKELCELIGTKKIRTTPYHPRGNPVERFNRTLINMLGTLENQKKSHWRDYVKPLVHAYNCTKNETTGFTPYELMFGRQPRLPVDLAFGLTVNHQPGSHSQYVRNLKSQLEDSYKVATENAKKTASRNKARFDKHVVDSTLKEGDRVLVRNVRLRGKHKLADRWESDVYVVQRQSGDVPVYVVRPETRDGPQRTLHRDLLLPCGFLPVTSIESETNPSMAVRRQRTRQHPKNDSSDGANGDESQSDSEEYYYDGHRNLRVEILGFDPTPEPIEHLPEGIEPEPSKELTAVKQGPSDVTIAFPEDVPVETYDLNLPDPGNNDLPDPEESSSTAGQETGNLPEEDLDNVHPSTQPAQEGKENTSVMDQTDIQTEGDCSRRPVRDRKATKRLTYPELGNPLITIVQSLFQTLSDVFTDSLEEPSFPKTPRVMTV